MARDTQRQEPNRAAPTGAYVATAGIVIFTLAVFFDWITDTAPVGGGSPVTYSGYETDSLVPFLAYLGIGFAIALNYAIKRAMRRQHRGLSLSSMAAGLGATGLSLSYAIDRPGALERGLELSPEIGVYVALIGASLWALGSGLLAKEPEGDDEDDRRQVVRDDQRAGSSAR